MQEHVNVTTRVPSAKSKRLDTPQDKNPLFLQQAHGAEEERERELSYAKINLRISDICNVCAVFEFLLEL